VKTAIASVARRGAQIRLHTVIRERFERANASQAITRINKSKRAGLKSTATDPSIHPLRRKAGVECLDNAM